MLFSNAMACKKKNCKKLSCFLESNFENCMHFILQDKLYKIVVSSHENSHSNSKSSTYVNLNLTHYCVY